MNNQKHEMFDDFSIVDEEQLQLRLEELKLIENSRKNIQPTKSILRKGDLVTYNVSPSITMEGKVLTIWRGLVRIQSKKHVTIVGINNVKKKYKQHK